MTNKKEKVFETLEDEVKYLRKQISGYKGRNNVLAKICAEHEAMIAELRDKFASVCKDNERLRNVIQKNLNIAQKKPWWRFW